MITLLSLLLTLLVIGIIIWFAFWIIDMLPNDPPPLAVVKLALKVVIGLFVLIYLIGLLTGYGGLHPIMLH